MLFEEDTPIAVTRNASALTPVPSDSLPTMRVDFQTGASLAVVSGTQLAGAPVEAHLFAEDLDTLNSTLGQIQSEVNIWDQVTSASEAPRDVVVPFPPNPSWNTSLRYSLPLSTQQFWPSVAPAGDAANPNGEGSVKSARVYYPGLCSTFQLFQQTSTAGGAIGIFDQLMDGLWSQFVTQGQTDTQRIFMRTTTLLDDGLNVTTLAPKGGFFFGFEFVYHLPVLTGDQTFVVNFQYLFNLVDGRVTLEPTQNALIFNGNPDPGDPFFDNDPIGSMVGSMTGKFPDQSVDQKSIPVQLGATFVEKQGIPSGSTGVAVFGFCASVGDPFAVARQLATNQLVAGEKVLGITDQTTLTSLSASIADPNNWRCNAGNQAEFILRAKRLNVYPDGIELVWFDHVDATDPMYAAYVMAVGLGQVTSLCDRSSPNVSFNPLNPFNSGFQFRPLTTDGRGLLCVDGSGNPQTCP